MAKIADKGRLVVGNAGDVALFGFRNPTTGRLEGFDIDVLREIAKAIFGPGGEDKIEYRVMNFAQRLPSLEDRSVDLVAHTMTINCPRWNRIGFSSTYFDAGQRVLIRAGAPATTIDELNAASARTVCGVGLDERAEHRPVHVARGHEGARHHRLPGRVPGGPGRRHRH